MLGYKKPPVVARSKKEQGRFDGASSPRKKGAVFIFQHFLRNTVPSRVIADRRGAGRHLKKRTDGMYAQRTSRPLLRILSFRTV